MTRDWHPQASLPVLRRRAAMLERAREYFRSCGVLEVETPLLSAAAVSDVNIESAAARACGRDYYLHTSPEYSMKRLLAAGYGDCAQICRVFRDGERGRLHHPEFTMIEWYRVGFSAAAMMTDVERLLAAMLRDVRPLPAARHITYRAALREHAAVDAFDDGPAALRGALQRAGVDCPVSVTEDRDALLDLIVGTVVGPRLGLDAPCFVTEYPASQAALARIRRETRRSPSVSNSTSMAWNSRTGSTNSATPANRRAASSRIRICGGSARARSGRSTDAFWRHSMRACRTAPVWRSASIGW